VTENRDALEERALSANVVHIPVVWGTKKK